jgi:hypothetical protein
MPHYKDQNNKLHFLDSEEHQFLLPQGCVKISDAEADSIRTVEATKTPEELATEARDKRNRLLAQVDWTQCTDISPEVSSLYISYRQALRDITAQPDFPLTINWPTLPQ